MHRNINAILKMKSGRLIEQLIAAVHSPRTFVVIQNIVTSAGGRAVNIVSTIVTVPIAVRALGQEQYGTLAIIISITNFFVFADFGLGAALVTELAGIEAKGKQIESKHLISQVWFILIGCSVAIAILGYIAYFFGLHLRFMFRDPGSWEVNAWFMMILSSAIGVPFAIAQRIFFALQMGFVGQLWATAGRVSVFIGVILTAYFSPRLDWFVAAFVLMPNLVACAATYYLFIILRPDLRPSLSYFSFERLGSRLEAGISFTSLQFVNFAESGIDTLLIGYFYDAKIVAQYDLLSRLFNYVLSFAGMCMWPLWPAISSAAAQHDMRWILGARRISYVIAVFAMSTASMLLWFWSTSLIVAWTGVVITLPDIASLNAAFAIFVTINGIIALHQIFLNAFNDMKVQSIVSVLTIGVLVPTKYFLLKHGILSGIVFASIATYIPKVLLFDFAVRQHIGRMIRAR